MEQLSLFDDLAPTRAARPPDPEVPAEGAQLDLFSDRMLLLSDARAALTELDPGAARRLLREALGRYGHDRSMAAEIEALDHLAFQIERALRAPAGERPEALLAVAASIEPLRRGEARRDPGAAFPGERVFRSLSRRAGMLAVERSGDAALVGGLEPGWLLLLGGDIEAAEASIGRCARETRRPRFVALLGECARRRGDVVLARQLYLSALREDPYDVDFAAIGDPEVSSLPAEARYRFEIEDEPLAWSAVVGVVTGVLQLPLFTEDAAHEPLAGAQEPPACGHLPAPRREALSRATRFLSALSRARMRSVVGQAGVLEARRTMKRLQPALFEGVMGYGDR